MLLEIDTNYLIEQQINAHQFVIIKLIYDNDIRRLKNYLINTGTFDTVYKDLVAIHKKGFLADLPSNPPAFNKLKSTSKLRKITSFTEDPFEEFYDTFPTKVLRPSGDYDYLRIDQKRSKKIYHNIIGNNLPKHNFIIKCLKAEIKDKASRGQMSFFKRMPTWLTSESWKAYADVVQGADDSIQDDNTVAYGQDVE